MVQRKYINGAFSSGLAKGLPHGDNYYLRIDRLKRGDGSEDDFFLFLRKDEMMVLIEVMAAALWTREILERRTKRAKRKKSK